jgi:cell division topological specificity factor
VNFIKKYFGGGGSSAEKAKKRLQLVLIHDHTDISPRLMENLRVEMIGILRKYMDIDESKIVMNLDHLEEDAGAVALVANIPVLRVKRVSAADDAGTMIRVASDEPTAADRQVLAGGGVSSPRGRVRQRRQLR